jgi:hypothetical protein
VAAVNATTAEAAAGEATAKATAEAPEQKALTSVGIETNGGRGGIEPDGAGSTQMLPETTPVSQAPCGAGAEAAAAIGAALIATAAAPAANSGAM